MTIDAIIRAETPADVTAIDEVHGDAFKGDAVLKPLVAGLRQLDAPLPTMSLVAQSAPGELVGHVMLSHAWLDAPERLFDIRVLSPLGVTHRAQGQGIGTALLRSAIRLAQTTAAPLLLLEGSPAFYGPRGFEPAQSFGIRSPSLRIPERALQAMRLPSCTGGMTGTLVYRDLWWELDCVGLR